MRIVSASVENFASYKSLDFIFGGQGLTLIQGATGSGKSTLCDLVPWILFGVTSKDGTADEIRSWNSEDATVGDLAVEINNSTVYVTRIRGKSNDLYFSIDASPEVRGKDLKDTQKLINELLGMTAETYLAGAYLHEFSKAASFFISSAKHRRLICEQIVDLSLSIKLNDRLQTEKKSVKDKHSNDLNALQKLETSRSNAEKTVLYLHKKYATYATDMELARQANERALLVNKKAYTQASRDATATGELVTSAGKCNHCGAPDTKLLMQFNDLKAKFTSAKYKYESSLRDQKALANTENTYEQDVAKYEEIFVVASEKIEQQEALVNNNTQEALDLELLTEINEQYRSSLIGSTVEFIQDQTNRYLSDYFDAEIKVNFDVTNADKIDVSIYINGNLCSYSQLSKGQRGLLKLCYGVSVMAAVANKSGIQFNSIFLDEALDGLDDSLKVKSYGLLQHLALSYENVFVVEHNESLKSLFEKSYTIELHNGESRINEKPASNEEGTGTN